MKNSIEFRIFPIRCRILISLLFVKWKGDSIQRKYIQLWNLYPKARWKQRSRISLILTVVLSMIRIGVICTVLTGRSVGFFLLVVYIPCDVAEGKEGSWNVDARWNGLCLVKWMRKEWWTFEQSEVESSGENCCVYISLDSFPRRTAFPPNEDLVSTLLLTLLGMT